MWKILYAKRKPRVPTSGDEEGEADTDVGGDSDEDTNEEDNAAEE